MVIAIPMLIASSIVFRNWWQRVACLGAVGLALLAQVFSYTRAGWLGMAAQALAFGLFTRRRALVLGVLACCLVLIFGLLASTQLGYQRDTVDPWTLDTRLAVWKLGLIELMKQQGVSVVFTEASFPEKLLQTLQQATGAKVYIISHIAVGSYSADEFEKGMRANAAVLVQALVTDPR